MLLSHKTTIKVNSDYSNIIGHMCYAAFKLWNVCNYERLHYKELGFDEYPNWYYQKKAHKDDLWARQLPSQTPRKFVRFLISHGSLSTNLISLMELLTQNRQDLNMAVLA